MHTSYIQCNAVCKTVTMVAEYNGTTGTADAGYSTEVQDLNIFYDVSLGKKNTNRPSIEFLQHLMCHVDG